MAKKHLIVLGISFLLVLPAGAIVDRQIKKDPSQKRPFVLDDALSLEELSFNPLSGISSDGQFMAYAVTHGYHESTDAESPYRYVLRGSYVYLHSLKTGERRQLTQGEEYSWTPSLSADAKKLAFYVWHNGKICIGIYDRSTLKTDFHELEKLKGKGPLIWNPGGTKLLYSPTEYILTGPVEPYQEEEKVIVRASWEEDFYERMFAGQWQQQQWALDPASGLTKPIIPGDITFSSRALSPDGQWIAVSEVIKQKVLIYLVPSYVQLDIYPIEGGKPRTVFSDKLTSTPYAWSPDSQSIVYISEGKMYMYSVREGTTVHLGKEGSKLSGTPLWSPDGRYIFCTSGEAWCLIDARSVEFRLFSVDIPYSLQPLFWDSNGKDLYFKAIETGTGKQGLYRYNPNLNKADKLIMGDWMISHISQAGRLVILTLQNSSTPENIWTLDGLSGKLAKWTDINKHVEVCTFGKSELVRWTSLAGAALKGVLLYPADYEKGRAYPVIFWVYENFSDSLHAFDSRVFYYLQIFANNGYAVFMPDIRFTEGETALSFKNAIVPALDKLVEMGLADGNFGLIGHSFGGFATNILISQTDRFKAAIASAGQSDWVSRQGAPGHFWSLGDERGQARLGGDLKDVPENFIKNSTVFFLNKVTTPLMIVHGTKDFCVQFNQAEEMYYGLRNLGKTAVLIGYQGEGHLGNGTAEWVIRDFWKRALSWFDKYLKPKTR